MGPGTPSPPASMHLKIMLLTPGRGHWLRASFPRHAGSPGCPAAATPPVPQLPLSLPHQCSAACSRLVMGDGNVGRLGWKRVKADSKSFAFAGANVPALQTSPAPLLLGCCGVPPHDPALSKSITSLPAAAVPRALLSASWTRGELRPFCLANPSHLPIPKCCYGF